MVSYDNLVKILQDNGLKKSDLTQVLGISSRTIVKIGKGEKNFGIGTCCRYGILTPCRMRWGEERDT